MANKTEALIECVFPGRVYEVIITSVWTVGNLQVDDPKEVYYPPCKNKLYSNLQQ